MLKKFEKNVDESYYYSKVSEKLNFVSQWGNLAESMLYLFIGIAYYN